MTETTSGVISQGVEGGVAGKPPPPWSDLQHFLTPNVYLYRLYWYFITQYGM